MAIVLKNFVLGKLSVEEAMRRQVISLSQTAAIDQSINYMIKYKANALLTTDGEDKPSGVVSKTDIMGAYYAALPIDSPLEHIMNSPPLFCRAGDSLDAALNQMRSNSIYRIYVLASDSDSMAGVLAYPDIVGLLYRYCHTCEYSHLGAKKTYRNSNAVIRYTVKDIMTQPVKAFSQDESLMRIIEGLSEYRFGAVLVTDGHNEPCGVISKSDLALAYKHGISTETTADAIMSCPVHACDENEYLEFAIQKMIFTEVHRLFVYRQNPKNIVGVLSLSDAARLRSGSCQACVSSRIKIDEHS
jgi:predicted transcriptional regulator